MLSQSHRPNTHLLEKGDSWLNSCGLHIVITNSKGRVSGVLHLVKCLLSFQGLDCTAEGGKGAFG